jgi:hypothetical protein
MVYLWSTTLAVGMALQVLVISAMLRGWWRKFKVLFVYCVVLFLSTGMEAAAFYDPEIYTRTSRYYWSIDAVRQVLIFLIVISLVYMALGPGAKRAAVRRLLGLGVLGFAALSMYFTWNQVLGQWMTDLSRNLGFLAVLLNLVLWAVLIQARPRQRTLLMISGGMGIQMAGKAIGHSMRQLSGHLVLGGNLVIVCSHLVCLYAWWQAFRRLVPETTAESVE